MKVAIHQPHFLPWLGYLHRMAQADLFVLLDHVQFERRNYQNRTMIRLADQGHWLTVPVVQNSQKERIVDKLVDNRLDGTKWWSANHFATLRHAYRAAPFFDVYAQSMQRLFETKWQRLVDINPAGKCKGDDQQVLQHPVMPVERRDREQRPDDGEQDRKQIRVGPVR